MVRYPGRLWRRRRRVNLTTNGVLVFDFLRIHVLELTTEAAELADAYLQHGILSQNLLNDARHIARATVAKELKRPQRSTADNERASA